MSDRLPRITGKQLLAALQALGFEVVRVRGSHHFVRDREGRTTVVPVHAGEVIGPGLLGKILRDCEITRQQLGDVL
jgi:predicted RNA binding protein YcfA (HicA-like mRNA interferase family)